MTKRLSFALIACAVLLSPLTRVAPSAAIGCAEWRECRRLALAAAARQEYESFHDLAWRAVQTGPRNDPGLMYLLARAQSLSGRPHDALVMLHRLVDLGVAIDADTSDDFKRTRALDGWAALAARLGRPTPPAPIAPTLPAPIGADAVPASPAVPDTSSPAPDSSPSPTSTPAPLPSTVATEAPPTAIATPTPIVPRSAEVVPSLPEPPRSVAREIVRLSTTPFAVGGLAYDAASQRLVMGDRLERRLVAVSEGSRSAADLVRAESAGFQEIAALEIDPRRGDLWVASNAPQHEGAGILHRLQLISGRPLQGFVVGRGLASVNLTDLAISSSGMVLILDSENRQLFALRPRGLSIDFVLRLSVEAPVSIAAGIDEDIAYLAHRDGISRIDLRTRTLAPLTAPPGVSLERVARIRRYQNALVGSVAEAGIHSFVRFDLNSSGRTVARATTIERSETVPGQAFFTIAGEELAFVAAPPGRADGATASKAVELVAYRLRLR